MEKKIFEIGDKVAVLDDTITGRVVQITQGQITIETTDGFPLNFEPSELIRINIEDSFGISNLEVARSKAEKEIPKRNISKPSKTKERYAPKMEVDLHIGQLVPSIKGLTNFDMLNLQLEAAQRQLEFAIRKRIQKVVFIHGVGEGVLKEELYYLFKRYDNVKYYDADYQKYGLGATEVYIYRNS
ncbi:DNA mismatch repair protein MutS [Flavobacteriaceae bacterium F89]|uniref:DNA mismatch repair protein MutS n=1 Tax=Cerina litoralis TaxID=2874477 RepID=A0AAE3EXH8_9FLAO|nr:Smr/MutS family protein [Cerina litoralis]MCG2461949.1 DNA mismatch repair protein MutS [Cerina litoralis]